MLIRRSPIKCDEAILVRDALWLALEIHTRYNPKFSCHLLQPAFAINDEIRVTKNVYLYEAPPTTLVIQLPGSMYPTATSAPGPKKAFKFCQKLLFFGVSIDWFTSESDTFYE